MLKAAQQLRHFLFLSPSSSGLAEMQLAPAISCFLSLAHWLERKLIGCRTLGKFEGGAEPPTLCVGG